MKSSRNWLFAAGLLIEAGCIALAVLATGEGERRVFLFLPVMFLTGIVYLAAVRRVSSGREGDRAAFLTIIFFAVIFYATLLAGRPIFDNDIHRYIWDGKVTLEGINPYQYAPRDPALSHLRDPSYHLIGYPELPTPYPPMSQLISALMVLMPAGGLLAARLLLGVFFLASLWAGCRLLDMAGRDGSMILLFAWNPLVLKEFANSGHMEPAVIFFVLASAALLFSGRDAWSGVLLALAALTKFFPLFLAPFFFFRSRRKASFAAGFALTAALLYLPFFGAGIKVIGSLGTYLKYWLFNHGAFELWEWAAGALLPGPFAAYGRTAYWMAALAASLIFGWKAGKGGMDDFCRGAGLFLFFLVILSPTVMPWYITWCLPLLIFRPVYPVLLFSVLVNASYLYYFFHRDVPAVRWTEYGLLIFAAVLQYYRTRADRHEAVPCAGSPV